MFRFGFHGWRSLGLIQPFLQIPVGKEIQTKSASVRTIIEKDQPTFERWWSLLINSRATRWICRSTRNGKEMLSLGEKSCPNLNAKGVLAHSDKGHNLQVLFQGLEEYLYLSSLFVHRTYCGESEPLVIN